MMDRNSIMRLIPGVPELGETAFDGRFEPFERLLYDCANRNRCRERGCPNEVKCLLLWDQIAALSAKRRLKLWEHTPVVSQFTKLTSAAGVTA